MCTVYQPLGNMHFQHLYIIISTTLVPGTVEQVRSTWILPKACHAWFTAASTSASWALCKSSSTSLTISSWSSYNPRIKKSRTINSIEKAKKMTHKIYIVWTTTSFCYLCRLLDQWKWFSKWCNQSIKDWKPWAVQQLLHLWHPTYMQWDFHWEQGGQLKALISFWD
jgi:hypothetical protein